MSDMSDIVVDRRFKKRLEGGLSALQGRERKIVMLIIEKARKRARRAIA